nr:hypothetical protein [Tumebacillus amylolyticus]
MKPADAVYTWYDYWESSGYYYNASPRKTSPDYGCPSSAPAPCTLSLQYSLTQSKSANVSLSLPEWNAIKATLGYTYQDQASVAATYALPVPPGKYGHMEFAPKYYHSEGTMEAWMSSISGVQLVGTQYVGCETPQKLQTGFLDGYAIGVITNSPT